MAIGPGVIWEMVMRSVNSSIDSQPWRVDYLFLDQGHGGISAAEAEQADLEKAQKQPQAVRSSLFTPFPFFPAGQRGPDNRRWPPQTRITSTTLTWKTQAGDKGQHHDDVRDRVLPL